MELNERIRLARSRTDLTQKDVADHFGISRPTVAQWEAGTHRPDQDKFPELAALLGVTLDWLMNEGGNGPANQTHAHVPQKFLKSSKHKFYVREWREFMVGDRVDGAAAAAGLDVNGYQAFETYPINFTLGQILAIADEIGIRGDQFWFPPPKGKPAPIRQAPAKKRARRQ